jgi:hypothetical protein
MYTKLTLNIRKSVIEKAKRKAKKRKKSLSRIIENFLENLSRSESDSFVDDIICNAPSVKTKKGDEKNILRNKLKAKYES